MEKQITSEEIYNDLLSRIISLELEPGSMISENQVCEYYHVSRSVIRNVFARLSQVNFITIVPQRGTFVNKVNLDYIKKALLLRLSLEKEMLYRFMKSEKKEEIIKELEKNIKKQEKYYSENKYVEEFKLLDEDFHNKLMSSGDVKNVFSLIEEHLLHINRWRNIYIREGHSLGTIIEEHKQILQYLRENNLKGAQDLMQEHIKTIAGAGKRLNDYFVE